LQHLLIDCLNKESIVDVPTVFRAMEQEHIHHARDTALNAMATATKSIETSLPLAADALTARVAEATKGCLACFDHMVAGTTLEEEAQVRDCCWS